MGSSFLDINSNQRGRMTIMHLFSQFDTMSSAEKISVGESALSKMRSHHFARRKGNQNIFTYKEYAVVAGLMQGKVIQYPGSTRTNYGFIYDSNTLDHEIIGNLRPKSTFHKILVQ